ncbi:hypothetical protein BSI23_004419 [Salmonella enterica subsp. enterica serovar Braenderup]|nr:hypothetical protein [Salmonella enterica]EDQ5692099.1 hypothetical protein [Salmonella enterica]EDQ6254480.1 hypothetical protein [Salmonella enterica subsp. enterica serovar Braenderup]EDQ8026264.1 hypothetical protein [Salmonella enterica subsp. enterica serovar Braenderup]EDR0449260.1 hypothetical protein [Salmonella enterica subsp. enterica serovar Braenderup]EDS0627279.1 hypothetical protein [Salmonella enterica subsp. enterica serovar Braenderup]
MHNSQQAQDIQVFSINGPLKVTERFAYDNRYVLRNAKNHVAKPFGALD